MVCQLSQIRTGAERKLRTGTGGVCHVGYLRMTHNEMYEMLATAFNMLNILLAVLRKLDQFSSDSNFDVHC